MGEVGDTLGHATDREARKASVPRSLSLTFHFNFLSHLHPRLPRLGGLGHVSWGLGLSGQADNDKRKVNPSPSERTRTTLHNTRTGGVLARICGSQPSMGATPRPMHLPSPAPTFCCSARNIASLVHVRPPTTGANTKWRRIIAIGRFAPLPTKSNSDRTDHRHLLSCPVPTTYDFPQPQRSETFCDH